MAADSGHDGCSESADDEDAELIVNQGDVVWIYANG